MLPDIRHHFHDLDIGTAVLWPLKGRHGCRHGGIRIGTGGSYHTRRKGRIITAAMLHMQDQGGIQHLRLRLRVFFIRSHQHQQIFRRGQGRIRMMDKHTLVFFIMIIGIVAVNCQHGKFADQLDALAQGIADGSILGPFIIRRQRQNASGHGIHDILRWCFHDHIPGKVRGKRPTGTDQFLKLLLLLLIRQFPHQQQIGDFFKAQFVLPQIPDQMLYPISSVPELPVAGHFFAVLNL